MTLEASHATDLQMINELKAKRQEKKLDSVNSLANFENIGLQKKRDVSRGGLDNELLSLETGIEANQLSNHQNDLIRMERSMIGRSDSVMMSNH